MTRPATALILALCVAWGPSAGASAAVKAGPAAAALRGGPQQALPGGPATAPTLGPSRSTIPSPPPVSWSLSATAPSPKAKTAPLGAAAPALPPPRPAEAARAGQQRLRGASEGLPTLKRAVGDSLRAAGPVSGMEAGDANDLGHRLLDLIAGGLGDAEGRPVLVIGGGIAGLSAATRLKQAGIPAVVLEASDRAGGRLSSARLGEIPYDRGAQIIFEDSPFMSRLVALAGLEDERVPVRPELGIVRGGKVHRISAAKPLSPLLTGLLRILDLARMALRPWWEFLSDMRRAFSLPLYGFSQWARLDDEDTETWTERAVGPFARDYVADPVLQLMFQLPRQVSKAMTLWLMRGLLGSGRVYTLKDGLGALSERLAERLDVRYNVPVEKVLEGPDGVSVVTKEGLTLRGRGAILAVPAAAARRMRRAQGREKALLDVGYAHAINVTVKTRRNWRDNPRLRDLYALNFPEPERGAVSTISFESSKPGRVPPGREVLQIFLSHEAAGRMMDWPDEAILKAVAPELDRRLPGFSASIEDSAIVRWPRAMPSLSPGRVQAIERYRASPDPARRVVLAGDYAGFPGTDGAAESGVWAAGAFIGRE